MKYSGILRLLSVVVGMAVALTITFSQLFFSQALQSKNDSVDTEQSSSTSSNSDVSYISLPSGSLPASTQVELNQSFSFILEILFEDEKLEVSAVPGKTLSGKLLKTLFQVIIAPNAP